MKYPIYFTILYAIYSVALSLAPAHAGDCMIMDAGPQAVEGKISIEQRRDAADRLEYPYILTPFSHACLDGKDPKFEAIETKTVHIFSSNDALHARLKSYVGKTVLVWGTPFEAHTAHHHAPIVMDITKIVAD